jgi:hypothetical protein
MLGWIRTRKGPKFRHTKNSGKFLDLAALLCSFCQAISTNEGDNFLSAQPRIELTPLSCLQDCKGVNSNRSNITRL